LALNQQYLIRLGVIARKKVSIPKRLISFSIE
jgi:hypothetical protein